MGNFLSKFALTLVHLKKLLNLFKFRRGFLSKTQSIILVLVLISELAAGAFIPVKFSSKPPYISSQQAQAAGEGWFNTGGTWNYRRAITLSPATPAANYQVKVTLSSSVLTGAQLTGGNANGNDIRFTGSGGTTLQNYWTESWSATGTTVTATIWVKVVTSGESTIYMYYGNASAPAASSGTNTFDFFDDFEDGNFTANPAWTDISSAYSVASETLSGSTSNRLTSSTQSSKAYVSSTFSQNASWEWDYYNQGQDPFGSALQQGFNSFIYVDDNNLAYAGAYSGNTFYVVEGGVAGCSYDSGSHTIATGILKYKVTRAGNVWTFYVNDVQKYTCTYNYTSGSTQIRYQTGMSGGSGYPNRIDNLRVRQYAASDPAATLGNEEYFDHYTVTGTGTMNAGASQVITITAKTNLGNTYNFTGDKSLTFSGPGSVGGNNPTCTDKTSANVNFGTATTLTLASGIGTCTMKLYKAESVSVDVTDGTVSSAGDAAYDLDVVVSSLLSGTGIQVNSNATYTNSNTVTLTLAATGAQQMKFSNDNITFSTYETFGTSKSWNITNSSYGGTSADGTKTVYATYNDTYGNESVVNDSIVYDTTAPTGTTLSFGTIDTSSIVASVSGASDALSGLATAPYYFENTTATTNSGWQSGNTWSSGSLSINTQYTFKVTSKDKAGNTQATATQNKYTLANTPSAPTVNNATASTLGINPNANSNPSNTQFAIYKEQGASCDGTGGSYIAADGSDNGSTEAWQTDSQWDTTNAAALAENTQYSFCVKARNGDNTETSFGTASSGTTTVSNQAPNAPTLVSPASGSYISDNTPTLSSKFSDPDAGNIGTTNYRISSTNASDCNNNLNIVASGTSSSTSTNNENTSWTPGSSIGSDRTYYWCAQNTDGSHASSWTSMGSFILDTTAPNSFDLVSPDNNSYTNEKRPTFKWKAASTPDAASGLSKYKLEVDNGDTGDFTIDDIPPSRTTDYDTSKYTVKYEGFSDSDSSNNYVSVYTKHSTGWGANENDGELKPGKRTWKVIAYDNVGQSREASRTLYADFTNPSLGSAAFADDDILGTKDGYTVVSTLNPLIYGNVSDNNYPDKIEISFSRQNFLFGIETNRTLFLKETFDLKNTDKTTTVSFSLSPSLGIDYGKYSIEVVGIDAAGNMSSGISLNLWALSDEKAKILLKEGKSKEEQKKITDKIREKSQFSIPALEKNAVLRREKEASEFKIAIQELRDSISGVPGLVSNIYSTSIAWIPPVADKTKEIAEITQEKLGLVASNISDSLVTMTKSADNTYQEAAKAAPGIVGDAMLTIGKTARDFADLNYKLGTEFAKEQENINKKIGQTQQEIGENINTGISSIVDTGETISDGIGGVNKELVKSQETAKKQIADIHKNTSKTVSRIGSKAKEGGEIALHSILNPAVKSKNFADKLINSVRIAVVTFQSYMFDDAPTKIDDVALTEVGKDYAIVTWKTNHYTRSNKVNYGESLTYNQSSWGKDGEKNHKVKMTNLKPGVKYFFEVMSQNKNYAYDAYYSFETKK